MEGNAILTVMGGDEDGKTIPLSKDAILIGRGSETDVRVDVPGVALVHARIRSEPDGYWIQDVGSIHGTFVNGQRVGGELRRLQNFDRIQVRGEYYAHLEFIQLLDTVPTPRKALWWSDLLAAPSLQPHSDQLSEAKADSS